VGGSYQAVDCGGDLMRGDDRGGMGWMFKRNVRE